MLQRVLECLEFAWHAPQMCAGLIMIGVVSLLAAAVTVLMPVFASRTFYGGPRTSGLLLGSVGIGALGGATARLPAIRWRALSIPLSS